MYKYTYTFSCFLQHLLEESGTSSKHRVDALTRSPVRAPGGWGSPRDAPTGCPPTWSPLQPTLGPTGDGRGGGFQNLLTDGTKEPPTSILHQSSGWGTLLVRSSCPLKKMGALFMSIRAEDAKQICSQLQLVPVKFPGAFPVLWKKKLLRSWPHPAPRAQLHKR